MIVRQRIDQRLSKARLLSKAVIASTDAFFKLLNDTQVATGAELPLLLYAVVEDVENLISKLPRQDR